MSSVSKKSIFITAALAVLMLSGCANRWREGSTGKDSREVGSHIDALATLIQSSSDPLLGRAVQMAKDPTTRVYFAEANGLKEKMASLGPIYAVTPVEFDILQAGLFEDQISNIRVYFISRLAGENKHEAALIFEITVRGNPTAITKTFVTDQEMVQQSGGALALGDVQEGTFMMTLGGPLNNQLAKNDIIIISDDIVETDLKDVIQLELSYTTPSGQVFSMGQLSTLVGYGD